MWEERRGRVEIAGEDGERVEEHDVEEGGGRTGPGVDCTV